MASLLNDPRAALDHALVAVVVFGAFAFLARRLQKPPPKACHPQRTNGANGANGARDDGVDVIVGASLARGLARAKARAQQTPLATRRS